MTISPVSGLQAARIIVDPVAGRGNYTTIQAAINAASSGMTILIKPGTYTENLTLKAGVNLTAFTGDDDAVVVKIIGKCSFSSAGTALLSNLAFQTNGDYILEITGSAASFVSLDDCSLFCTNSTGIHNTSSSASAIITLNTCSMDLQATGISYFTHASAGVTRFEYCILNNTGSSTTASTCSSGNVGYFYTQVAAPTTISATGGIQTLFPNIDCSAINTTALNAGGSGVQVFFGGLISSGTAVAITITGSLNLTDCTIRSSNTNAITGGTLSLANLSFTNSAGVTSTIVKQLERHGISLSTTQPAFFSYLGSTANNTIGDGAGSTYTLGTDALTELYDQNGDITTGGVFTAPYTGKYYLFAQVVATGCTVATGMTISCVTTSKTYTNTFGRTAGSGDLSASIAVNAPMTAGDTATWTVFASGEAAASDDIVGSASPQTYVMGYLIC